MKRMPLKSNANLWMKLGIWVHSISIVYCSLLYSTSSVMVAENNMVCRPFGENFTISSI